MVILDKNGDVVESPDYEKGHVNVESMPVTHKYVIDTEEKGHWEIIAEYPDTGGADVEWRVDTEESGHWETVDEEGKQVEHYDGAIAEDWPHEQDIPDVWSFGRYVEYTEEELEEIERQKAEAEAARAAETQRMTAISLFVQTADLTDDQAISVSTLYPEWATGVEYEARQIVRDGGHLFRCAQKHTSSEQNNTSVASLWTQIDKAGDGVDVWQQPTGAHDAYNKGDRVHYPDADGPIYVSQIDGNTWSPDAYPAGWELEGGAD